MKSTSSGQRIPSGGKIREWAQQFVMLSRSCAPWNKPDFSGLERDLASYGVATRAHGHFDLQEASAFEIGCGQRPFRLLYLIAKGIDAYAVDLDRVVNKISFDDAIASLKANGLERTMKTLVRHYLFDGAENTQFRQFLADTTGQPFRWPADRISHGSAADGRCWPHERIDLVYSEDVFEHIPPKTLPIVCEQIAAHLTPRGIAYIKPLVFTGIQGGHNVDWYNVSHGAHRRCPPWDHLRLNRCPANTYLNRLRLDDYRRLFQEHFRIVEETVVKPNLGHEYMTPALREELGTYSDEDLYSNSVIFVLRPRRL